MSAGSLSVRWVQARNRVLSSPRFQRWAARFPLTRGVARRRASALFDLCAGFVYSQVLHAATELQLLELLAEGPLSVEDVADATAVSIEGARRLLEAAATLDLVEPLRDGRYALGIHGASFVGNPAVAAMVRHHALLYRDLADPVALLRGGRRPTELGRFWAYAGQGGADVAAYSGLMAASLPLLAEDVVEAYPLRRHHHLLDVGGGEGAFLEEVARRAPHLSLTLFDLPPVAERARARLGARARVVGGDMLRDPLPVGADVATLVRVVHDHDDDDALAILRAVRRALRPGGVLLVAEPMLGTKGAEPMGAAYFGFYLLAMGRGRPRPPAELRAMLAEAGFAETRLVATNTPLLTRVLVADVGAS